MHGLLAVVTASDTGAVVLAAIRHLGNLQFPVSGIILSAIDYASGLLGSELRRCRAFKIQLRECLNPRDLDFVRGFPGLRLVAVDLQEEANRLSDLRDELLADPCIDLLSLPDPAAPRAAPA
ncbi:MAG: hypothetical protein ACREJ2_19115, partial [Planctomycetota bacterium]